MAGSIRTEAIRSLDLEIDTTGKISQQRGIHELQTAVNIVRHTQNSYEQAMFNAIKLVYPRFYRGVVYGSARLNGGDPDYEFARELSVSLVEEIKDIDISSGGGPGIMTAVHEGSLEARKKLEMLGISVRSQNWGILINSLTSEQKKSPHDRASEHRDFPTRLMDFTNFSHAGIYLPGGYGTNYELAHGIQLKQVGHLDENYPLIAHSFWRPILDALYETAYFQRDREDKTHLISMKDLDLIKVTDKIPEMVSMVARSHSIWKVRYNDKLVRQPNGLHAL